MKRRPKKKTATPNRIRKRRQQKSASPANTSPPKNTQYRPGKSGNPKGRPKGSKNLSTLLMAAARAPVTATINGKPRKISTLQATIMQLATKAASGDRAAIGKFLDLMDEFEMRAAAARPAEFPLSDLDVEVLRAVYERMKACARTGPEA